ncbi:hypothetical protein RHMOL_Rhmol11G0150500 [Rhododendron molle]|uniref:Uncharacterized protein n=1 Tax=Rhododendron molle TaxID=49168 RepID=A0ACC0LTF2_RHOML|nr:hypothetical protein RHMOL_Rhmol11G0150500 [Rhododendron molle]
MHLKRATPVLFVQCACTELEINFDKFIFDEGAKADQMIRKMSAKFMQLECTDSPHLCGSCNGLLVFRTDSYYSRGSFVVNPSYQGKSSYTVSSSSKCSMWVFLPSTSKGLQAAFGAPKGQSFRILRIQFGKSAVERTC